MERSRKLQAWNKLIAGKSVDSLAIERKKGKLDLTDFVVSPPVPVRATRYASADVTQLAGVTNVRGVRWSQIDLTHASLDDVNFWNSEFSECLFESCSLRQSSFWGSTISKSSFRDADLRGAVLAPVSDNGARNRFEEVDFSKADLRRSVYTSADFRSCLFKNSKLAKVNFEGCTFTDCIFEGTLEEVSFRRHAYRAPNAPPNQMLNVDFSRAKLFWVEFYGLDLETVRFPEDEEHFIIDDYPRKLDQMIAALRARNDTGSRGLAAALAGRRKWVGPNQKRGILSKNEIRESADEETLNAVLKLLKE